MEIAILELEARKNANSLETRLSVGKSPMTRQMEHVAPGLEKIVATSLRRAPAGEGPALAWPLACGQGVAARTRALDFSEGVLRVEVPDAGWRAELQALAPQYLAVMNRYVAESIKRLEFIIAESLH
jgi:Dna[CI] antecedent, DciA